MAEEYKDQTNNPELHVFCEKTKPLLDAIIDCERKHLFFNGLSHSEKKYAIKKAIENKSMLNSLEIFLRELLKNQDSELIERVRNYVTFKSTLCYFINILSIEKILLDHAKSEKIEEKIKLERQFDSKFQITAAIAEIDSKQSKQMKKENKEQTISVDSSENNKLENFSTYDIKGNTDAQDYNDSERFYDENQSMKQNSSYSELDVNDTKHIKQLLQMDELVKRIDGKTLHVKKVKVYPGTKKSERVEKHQNVNMKREKNNVHIERIKLSDKTSPPSYTEEKLIELHQQRLHVCLTFLNIDIEGYEKELRSVEESLNFLIVAADTVSLETFEIGAIFKEVSVKLFMSESERHINYTINFISSLQSVKGAKNIMKRAINFIFCNSVKANVTSKTRDTSSFEDDSFYSQLDKEEKIAELDELDLTLNKNSILFHIDTDGRKVFEVDDKKTFWGRKSTKVVLNYKDQNVKISFMDDQIVVSTENSELYVSIIKPGGLQDDVTQADTRPIIHN